MPRSDSKTGIYLVLETENPPSIYLLNKQLSSEMVKKVCLHWYTYKISWFVSGHWISLTSRLPCESLTLIDLILVYTTCILLSVRQGWHPINYLLFKICLKNITAFPFPELMICLSYLPVTVPCLCLQQLWVYDWIARNFHIKWN